MSSLSAQTIGGKWEGLNPYRGGSSVADGGDVDGDGVADLLTGNQKERPGGVASGSAFVFSGATGAEIYRFDGAGSGQQFGASVAGPGDLNGDGFADLLVGAPSARKVYLYSGATGQGIRVFDELTYGANGFGVTVASMGDLDGDGASEFLIGANISSFGGFIQSGSMFLFSGASGNLLHRFDGWAVQVYFGGSAADAGDVNGDGIPDIIIGATGASSPSIANCGGAFVYSGADFSLIHEVYGFDLGGQFGGAVANAGDTDQDGVPDFIVSDLVRPYGTSYLSHAYVYSGASGALLHRFDFVVQTQRSLPVTGTGDIDGDGADDFAVGIPGFGHMPHGGYALIFSGKTGELLQSFKALTQESEFGWSLTSLADRDGDGARELAVGAANTARTFVYSLDPFLHADAHTLSVSGGGTLQFDLVFPISEAGQQYAMLASLTGKGPLEVRGLEIPLTRDGTFDRFASRNPQPALQGAIGTLDANGRGQAILVAGPSLAPAIGRTIHFAAVTIDVGPGTGRLSSVVRYVEITP